MTDDISIQSASAYLSLLCTICVWLIERHNHSTQVLTHACLNQKTWKEARGQKTRVMIFIFKTNYLKTMLIFEGFPYPSKQLLGFGTLHIRSLFMCALFWKPISGLFLCNKIAHFKQVYSMHIFDKWFSIYIKALKKLTKMRWLNLQWNVILKS